ncbi:hypothetical protein [Latilactobacillus fuchuensis]|uniref:Deacetylase sirtuin-type domain-containing protein n=1 Tax=Latilactobacillus fuchuensis TaxID=164393 RepID=A0A2N9DWB1_9LACO|nr:hypothetical protein [Latilactobacillus fuchuensis]SPC38837.1 hypothetical protein LFUMFP_310001 [Latilactobacillus fuchuensis]
MLDSTMKMAKKHLNEAIKDDSLIIFVGAGVSANSGLPKWSELISEFKNEIDLTDETDYLKTAQYYYDTVGQQKYFQKIMDIFQPHIKVNFIMKLATAN